MDGITGWIVFLVIVISRFDGTWCLNCSGYKMIRKGGISCQDRDVILKRHNQYRQQIALGKIPKQPSAANMVEMIWDDELANTAQGWANLCSEDHDPSRQVQRFTVGQNLARSWTTRPPSSTTDAQPDFVHQIDGWFNEVKQYSPNGVNSGTGHYTQVIWSDTYTVGCGYSYYWDPVRGYTKNYVCNYGPAGNIRGYQPYTRGRPSCSNYGMPNSQTYSGLCSKGNYYPLGASCARQGYVRKG